jgi:hypothetical protein
VRDYFFCSAYWENHLQKLYLQLSRRIAFSELLFSFLFEVMPCAGLKVFTARCIAQDEIRPVINEHREHYACDFAGADVAVCSDCDDSEKN